MDIKDFEALPFSDDGSLVGQADPIPFFRKALCEFAVNGGRALVVLEQGDVKRAMIHVLKSFGCEVSDALPTDSYNFMLDVIHRENNENENRETADSCRMNGEYIDSPVSISGSKPGPKQSTNVDPLNCNRPVDIDILVGTTDALAGLLKHSAEIHASKILISDRYTPNSLMDALEKAWDCEVYLHYTRPELAGLGQITDSAGRSAYISDELFIEIIDPETGFSLPDGKWGEIVVTSLFPAKYPLLRYRTGDISRFIDDDTDRDDSDKYADTDPHRLDMIKNQTPGVF